MVHEQKKQRLTQGSQKVYDDWIKGAGGNRRRRWKKFRLLFKIKLFTEGDREGLQSRFPETRSSMSLSFPEIIDLNIPLRSPLHLQHHLARNFGDHLHVQDEKAADREYEQEGRWRRLRQGKRNTSLWIHLVFMIGSECVNDSGRIGGLRGVSGVIRNEPTLKEEKNNNHNNNQLFWLKSVCRSTAVQTEGGCCFFRLSVYDFSHVFVLLSVEAAP